MSRDRRKALVSGEYGRLSVLRQCELVGMSRSSHYYTAKGESEFNLDLMRLLGLSKMLSPEAQAIYQRPRTTIPNRQRQVYPYLLGGLSIECPNQVCRRH